MNNYLKNMQKTVFSLFETNIKDPFSEDANSFSEEEEEESQPKNLGEWLDSEDFFDRIKDMSSFLTQTTKLSTEILEDERYKLCQKTLFEENPSLESNLKAHLVEVEEGGSTFLTKDIGIGEILGIPLKKPYKGSLLKSVSFSIDVEDDDDRDEAEINLGKGPFQPKSLGEDIRLPIIEHTEEYAESLGERSSFWKYVQDCGCDDPFSLEIPFKTIQLVNEDFGINEDTRGSCMADWVFEFQSEITFTKKEGYLTLRDIARILPWIKSHKIDNWYEMYCGIKEVLRDYENESIHFVFHFDHGS